MICHIPKVTLITLLKCKNNNILIFDIESFNIMVQTTLELAKLVSKSILSQQFFSSEKKINLISDLEKKLFSVYNF